MWKKKIWMSGFILFVAGMMQARTSDEHQEELRFKTQGMTVNVKFYSPNTVRVYKVPEGGTGKKESFVVIKQPETVEVSRRDSVHWQILTSGQLTVKADTRTGSVEFLDAQGQRLLLDKDYGTQFTAIDDAGTPSFAVRQAFLLDKEEVIYGLGQQQTGKVNQRNQKLLLRQTNMKIGIPFIHSAKGYGLYWDNYSPTTFQDNPQEMSFDSEVGDCADYYFMYGGNADGVIAAVRSLTGQAPLYPLWTLGFWQSRERYKSPDELCEVIDRYRQLQVPLDGIVQDWQYWGCNRNWNSMDFQNPRYLNKMGDPEYMKYLPDGEDPNARYPEARIKSPKEMIDYVHRNHAHLIISVWASFGPWTKMYREMEKLGALYDFDTWPPNSGVKVYDAFNPKAREIYWQEMKKNLFDLGVDGWWLDATEPEHQNVKDKDFDVPTYYGSLRRVHNAFPLVSNMGVYEQQRKASDRKRAFLLTRSSFMGQQRYASHSWSGDIISSWETMRKQIAAGMNYSLCGIPYWNTDIGGFFAWEYNNDVTNVAYKELHVRWYQWATFQPIMRSHNSGPVAVEIYQFGKPGEWAFDALKKYTHLRYRLLPYLYSTAWDVTDRAGTILRPLMMDFGKDKKVLELGNEHMFGRSFLVRPVTEPLYTTKDEKNNGHFKGFDTTGTTEVYLPQGADWFDFWTGEKLQGGSTLQRETPIDLMPIYVKAGSIIPWGPDSQYATQHKWDNLTLRIYPGADAEFTLYEDEFDNYNYEKGAYSTIHMKWNDQEKTLTFGKRKGSYEGMASRRKFNIVIVRPGTGWSPDEEPTPDRTVSYNGKEKTIKLSF